MLNKFRCILIIFLYCLYKCYATPIQGCGIQEILPSDERTLSPWTVGIFIRSKHRAPIRYLVAGTIVSHDTVLTIFGSTFGANSVRGGKYLLPKPEDTFVVAGLNSSSLDDKDQFTQIVQVAAFIPYREIYFQRNETQSPENKDFHLVLLKLKIPLDLEKTPSRVRNICLPNRDILRGLQVQKNLQLGGLFSPPRAKLFTNSSIKSKKNFNNFGKARKFQVKSIRLSLKSNRFCEERYDTFYAREWADHVMCALIDKDEDLEPGYCPMHGSTFSFRYNNLWYFGGVNALIPSRKNGGCNSTSIYFIANLKSVLNWIDRNVRCKAKNFLCGSQSCLPLSKVCNLKKDCPQGEDEDEVYCSAINRCSSNNPDVKLIPCGGLSDPQCIHKDRICDGIIDCTNGNDEYPGCVPEIFKTTISQLSSPREVHCPIPQLSEGILISCSDPNGGEISCRNATVGVEAKLECDFHYVPKFRLAFLKMKCDSDRKWKPFKPFSCDPDCGIISSGFSSLIAHGIHTSSKIAFPWYGAIFRREILNSNNPGENEFKFICGATLIERKILITAAHCLTDATGYKTSPSELKVILAPISSNFERNLKDRFTQIFDVDKVWIPPTYSFKSLQSDIGIVKLKSFAKFGDFVRPVCYLLPYYSESPIIGSTGKIAGLGIDENDKISTVLKYTNYPVVSNEKCYNELNRVLPLSTFCGGFQNGTSVCKGLVFPQVFQQSERYILKGIVSHSELGENRLCEQHAYSVFTSIDSFASWILEILEANSN